MNVADVPYAVFFCPEYYPAGGLRDLKRVCVSLEVARAWAQIHFVEDRGCGHYDICHMPTLTIVESAYASWGEGPLEFEDINLAEFVEEQVQ